MKQWTEYDGKNSLAFTITDVVEVEFRDGRRATDTEPWKFSGWNWWPGAVAGRDIVRWRFVNS